MGHKRLPDIMHAREAIFSKADLYEADGIRSAEREADFAEMNGYKVEAEAAVLLNGIGIAEELCGKKLRDRPTAHV